MPSPLESSFTNRITRKSRKKVMEMRELSSELCGEGGQGHPKTPAQPPQKSPSWGHLPVPHQRVPRSVTDVTMEMDGDGNDGDGDDEDDGDRQMDMRTWTGGDPDIQDCPKTPTSPEPGDKEGDSR